MYVIKLVTAKHVAVGNVEEVIVSMQWGPTWQKQPLYSPQSSKLCNMYLRSLRTIGSHLRRTTTHRCLGGVRRVVELVIIWARRPIERARCGVAAVTEKPRGIHFPCRQCLRGVIRTGCWHRPTIHINAYPIAIACLVSESDITPCIEQDCTPR